MNNHIDSKTREAAKALLKIASIDLFSNLIGPLSDNVTKIKFGFETVLQSADMETLHKAYLVCTASNPFFDIVGEGTTSALQEILLKKYTAEMIRRKGELS